MRSLVSAAARQCTAHDPTLLYKNLILPSKVLGKKCRSFHKYSGNPISISSPPPRPSSSTMAPPIFVSGTPCKNPNSTSSDKFVCVYALYSFWYHVSDPYKLISAREFRWAGETDPCVIFRNVVQRPRHKATGNVQFLNFLFYFCSFEREEAFRFLIHRFSLHSIFPP